MQTTTLTRRASLPERLPHKGRGIPALSEEGAIPAHFQPEGNASGVPEARVSWVPNVVAV